MIIRAVAKQAQKATQAVKRWANAPVGCSTCAGVRKVIARAVSSKPVRPR